MFPLSFAQQRLWFFNRLEGPSPTYNVPVVARMTGPLDSRALTAALLDVVERHESLRTVFGETDGEPHQRVLPAAETGLELELVASDEGRLDKQIRETVEEPFDLDGDLPVRARLFAVAPDEHVLALVMHHVVCDGWSMTPLLRDLGAAYAARAAGGAPDWEPLPVQYTDYTLWQRDLLGSESDPASLLNAQLAHWREALADLPEELDLPYDRVRPAVATYQGAEIAFDVPAGTHAGLLEIARATGSTPYMVVQAAVAGLLSRLGAGTDIPIGTPVAGRTDQALDDLVGFFVNTQVLRTDLSGDPDFTELVRRVRETGLDAFTHQDVPFERIVEELNPVRSRAKHPLFQIGIDLHAGELTLDLTGLETRVELLKTAVAKFDLSFSLWERTSADGAPAGFAGALEYATELFDEATAASLVERFTRFLDAVVTAPDRTLSDIDVLAPRERELLTAWTETGHELPEKTVTTIFQERAAATPDATALVAGTTSLTFAELNTRVNRLAHHLIARGVRADRLVAVALPRTADAVVAWLAVGKAGGVYTPIDPQNPDERITGILADARPAVLVTTDETVARLGGPAGLPALVTDLDPAGLPDHDPTDTDRAVPLLLDHAAYVIYTSGSTGRPKGVTVLHRALTNLWTFHTGVTFPSPTGDADRRRVALSASLSFDTSWEGVLAMIAGHELHLLDEHTRRDPAHMVAYLRRHHVDQLDVTPSYAQQLLAEGLLTGEHVPATLMLGGEAVPEPLWQELRRAPRTRVFNYYGPSEFCVEASGCALPDHDASTIGRPVHNTRVHVLDEHLNPVPPGVLGELYLAGANLGRGYIGRPGTTASRFVANPFGAPGELMYRSGDMARWTPEGFLLFSGRSDDQVKLRGFRIEPAEIQTVIRAREEIVDAAVIVREDTPGDKRLVAYVVPAKGADLDVTALRTALGAVLPDYMVPAAFVPMENLPLTRNAKLDRRALPVPDYGSVSAGRAPRTKRELEVAELFAETLKIDTVSLDDNFFELGGHSLLATRLVNRIRTVLGVEVNLLKLFGDPTVAGVVASLQEQGTADGAARPRLVRRPS
ncbi:amino acid adenylation domain-containing protein [Streptomyces sp. NBC_01351]|uniref:non-ribosomal peptide synthetase n=1 Tax=Streptomyces sp. NBC_01351 TaxID=2903833 RepID=UPI002E345282|nr:amino acid adenylation domain-containing protein [Streptomyces sp. NBC_01351]